MKLADQIIYSLMNYINTNGYDIILPNFCYKSLEADVFKRTKNGYITEFEIKISRSDYFADFKKSNGDKHNRLKSGDSICNKFYFVVPRGLITKEEIPDYAGLITYNNKYFQVEKMAPFIHKRKPDSIETYRFLLDKVTLREQTWRNKVRILERQIRTIKI